MTQKEMIILCRKAIEKNIYYCNPEFCNPRCGKGSIECHQGIDWRSVLDGDVSYIWWMFSLSPLYYILERRPLPTEEHIQKTLKIIHSWINFVGEDVEKFLLLDKHATAVRGIVLALQYSYSRGDPLLKSALSFHAEHLMNDSIYDFGWNHGLDQDRALYLIGCELDMQIYRDHALGRMEKTIPHMVDEEGVTTEQATNYQKYAYAVLIEIKSLLSSRNENRLNALFERLDLMPDFLAHATYPNGKYIPIGDTPVRQAIPIVNTPAEFAATSGKKGIRPTLFARIYKESGYAFGRSGWGESRNFFDESCYSLRFGPGRYCHGHNDHTSFTYYTLGEEVICEGGFSGYADKHTREVVQRPEAHNICYTDEIKKFNWDVTTSMVYSNINGLNHSYIVEDTPYRNVIRRRSICFFLLENIIVVMDLIIAERPTKFKQIFHFSPQSQCVRFQDNQLTFKGKNVFTNVMQCWPVDSVAVDYGNNANFCFTSNEKMELIPVCSLISTRFMKISTFLTIFSFLNKDHEFSIQQLPVKKHNISRNLIITGDKDIKFTIYEDGRIIGI